MNWQHKDIWSCRDHKMFALQVSRHTSPTYSDDPSDGPNRWCIYAFIYPEHPRFDEFLACESMWGVSTDIPFHGGCTLLQQHSQHNKVTSIEIGCDYHHLGDNHYTFLSTKEEAASIFNDAARLFEHLTPQPQ